MKKVLLLDDEPDVLNSHSAIFALIPGYEIVTETSSIRAVAYLKNNPVDLLVFDVEMDGLNGLEMLSILPTRPKLLMVTGHDKYIVPGYLDDIDFGLTKPLLIPHLMKALSVIFGDERPSAKVLRPKLLIKDKETKIELLLDPEEVSVIESKGNDLNIYFIDGSCHTQRKTLEQIYEDLPKDQYVQVHRSFIINIENLLTCDTKSHKIQLRGYPVKIIVTDKYRDDFMEFYKRFQ